MGSKMKPKKDIFERVNQLEQVLLNRINRLEELISVGKEGFEFINGGLKVCRDAMLKESQINAPDGPIAIWNKRIQKDKDLRYPHKKIMEALLEQYDYQQSQFKKTHFSQLVKDAKIGKNKANEYLQMLKNKGYVEQEKTPYRTFFRLKYP